MQRHRRVQVVVNVIATFSSALIENMSSKRISEVRWSNLICDKDNRPRRQQDSPLETQDTCDPPINGDGTMPRCRLTYDEGLHVRLETTSENPGPDAILTRRGWPWEESNQIAKIRNAPQLVCFPFNANRATRNRIAIYPFGVQ